MDEATVSLMDSTISADGYYVEPECDVNEAVERIEMMEEIQEAYRV